MSKSTKQTSESKPPEWSAPLFKQSASEASNLYASGSGGNTYTGSTVSGLSAPTMLGVNQLAQAGQNWNTAGTRPLYQGIGSAAVSNPFQNMLSSLASTVGGQRSSAETNLSDYASGNNLDPAKNPYFAPALQNQLNKTAAQIQSQFSGMGRYGSGANTGVLTDTLGNIRTQTFADQFNRNQDLQFAANNMIDSSRQANQGLQGNLLSNAGNMYSTGIVPDVRQLDLTKRAPDDMISSAQRSGNNNEARIFTQLKNKVVGMVDDVVPEYAQARKAFSGPTAVVDALEDGRKAFTNSLTPNQLRTQMLKMGDTEKEAYIQGARAAVADIMGTARNDALSARTAFMKGYNKEKLEILVGKEQAGKLLSALDAETAFTKTRDVVTGNSETAARLAAQADVGGAQRQPGMFRSALNMRFGDAAADVGDKALGGIRSAAARQRRTGRSSDLT